MLSSLYLISCSQHTNSVRGRHTLIIRSVRDRHIALQIFNLDYCSLLGGLGVFGGLNFFLESLYLSLSLSNGVLLCFDLGSKVAHLFVEGLWCSTLMVAENGHSTVGSVV